ncbi:MAG: hypothetical protein M3Q27_09845 [Actinomycetota bacterium]|nr:hypothetical protein [Actinomycetota bacterium]
MYAIRLAATAGALFVAMAVSAYIGYRVTRLGAVVLVLLSAVWLTVDELWEGPVLLAVRPGSGLTAADPVGIVGLLAGALLLLRRQPRPSARRGASPL